MIWASEARQTNFNKLQSQATVPGGRNIAELLILNL